MKNLGLIRIRCLELLSIQYPAIGVMIARVDGVTTRTAHFCHPGKSRIWTNELSRDDLAYLINRSDYVILRPKEVHNKESAREFKHKKPAC